MRRGFPGRATVALLVVSSGLTGCRLGNDRMATVAEPSSNSVEIEDLERQLDEIDRLLSDAERAFDGD